MIGSSGQDEELPTIERLETASTIWAKNTAQRLFQTVVLAQLF